MLIIASLDQTQLGSSTEEISRVLGLTKRSVQGWIAKEFPRRGAPREVHYLDFRQALHLVRKVCKEGRKLPDVHELYWQMRDEGCITECFPDDCISVRIANEFLDQQRAALLSGNRQPETPRRPLTWK